MSESYYADDGVTLHHGDALTVLASMPDQSVDCIVTSPPYLGLRDYGVTGTDWPAVTYPPMHGLPVVDVPAMTCPLGLEPDPAAYIGHLVAIFREARRVLACDGTLFLNLGDSYSTGKQPSAGGSPCGMDGTALAGCQGGDCPSTCRCDGHQACVAASSHTARSDTPPARGSGPCASDPSLDRKGSHCSCPDGLDSTRPSLTPQSSRATRGQQQTPTLARAQPLASPESTPAESSQPHLAECSRSDSRECAQREPRSYVCDAPRCGRSWVCTCGTSQPSDSSADRRMGKESSGSAWGESTIKFLPSKNMLGIPWQLAFALQADGWILRSDTIWAKPNGMPESTKDRPSRKHEHVFLFAKSGRYWFDLDAIREPLAHPADRPQNSWARDTKEADVPGQRSRQHRLDRPGKGGGSNLRPTGRQHLTPDTNGGRNPGDVWTIPTSPFPQAHYAVMAPRLAERLVTSGCKPGGVVLDPFSGAGTTGMVAGRHGRRYIGIDASTETLDLSLSTRLAQGALMDGAL